MEKENRDLLVLNMVNFYAVFEKEFIELLPALSNSEITPLLSRMLNEIHLQGKTSSKRLSKSLNISIPNTSRSVNQLYRLGYIHKTIDEKDRRIVYLTLSLKGLDLVKSFIQISQDRFLEKLTVLSDGEIDELNRSFHAIKALFIKMRELNQKANEEEQVYETEIN